jgi:hypothetical protein
LRLVPGIFKREKLFEVSKLVVEDEKKRFLFASWIRENTGFLAFLRRKRLFLASRRRKKLLLTSLISKMLFWHLR